MTKLKMNKLYEESMIRVYPIQAASVSVLHALETKVRQIFSIGTLGASINFPSLIVYDRGDQHNRGFALIGKSIAVPSPSWFKWNHQFSARNCSFLKYSRLPVARYIVACSTQIGE